MAKSKYKQYFEDMFKANKQLFMQFKLIHDDYVKDRKKYKSQFDEVGGQVMKICKDWESKLCGKMEKGSNAVFSANLADKFWEEVKKYYPFIDMVGIKIRKVRV
jgi:hypothetical protein